MDYNNFSRLRDKSAFATLFKYYENALKSDAKEKRTREKTDATKTDPTIIPRQSA